MTRPRLRIWLTGAGLVALLVCAPAPARTTLTEIESLLAGNQPERALQVLDDYLHDRPDDVRAQFLRARALVQHGSESQAAKLYQELIAQHPELPEPYINLAGLYAAAGRHEQARNLLLRALKTSPTYDAAYRNLSRLHTHMAAEAYQQALNGKSTIGTPELIALNELAIDAPETTGAALKPASRTAQAVNGARVNSERRDIETVTKIIHGWARAWSARDVDAYLGFYADTFDSGSVSRSEWRRQRRQRLAGKQYISVKVANLEIITKGDKAVASFQQHYQSDRFRDRVQKTLVLVRENIDWKIQREVSQ